MLCQKCGLQEATVHLETLVFRQKIEEHLCGLCAGERGSQQPDRLPTRRGDKTDKQSLKWKYVGEVRKPDLFPDHGLQHIERYVSRFLASKSGYATLIFSTLGKQRSLLLRSKKRMVSVIVIADFLQEAQLEAGIRTFFESRGIKPSQDYLAGNGEVRDAIRILSYPIKGNAAEVSALTKCILQELYEVSPADGLRISYHH